MFGFTRSTLIVAGLAGSGLAIPQASGWLSSQTRTQIQSSQPQLSAPSQLQQPSSIPGLSSPSQLNNSNQPPKPASSNPWFSNSKPASSNPWFSESQPGAKGRRLPIEPVPMPGEYVVKPETETALKTPDLRKIQDMTEPLGIVTVQVTLTPICSVIGPATDCQPRPYEGPFKITTIAGDRTIRVNTDNKGTFQARLRGGVYMIQPEGERFPPATGQTFTIVDGARRSLQLDFRGTVAAQPNQRPQPTQQGQSPTETAQPQPQPQSSPLSTIKD